MAQGVKRCHVILSKCVHLMWYTKIKHVFMQTLVSRNSLFRASSLIPHPNGSTIDRWAHMLTLLWEKWPFLLQFLQYCSQAIPAKTVEKNFHPIEDECYIIVAVVGIIIITHYLAI